MGEAETRMRPQAPSTVDELVRKYASDPHNPPLLAFPEYNDTGVEYEYFTGQDLDRLMEGAAKAYLKKGLKPAVRTVSKVRKEVKY